MATNWDELNGGDDDDVALRRAIAMSLGQDLPEESSGPSDVDRSENASQAGPAPVTAALSATNSMAAMGLDRKKMEEERLARSRKRKADEGSPPAPTRQRLLNDSSTGLTQPSVQMTAPSLNSMSRNAHQGSTALPKASPSGSLPYAKGTVLRTWARGTPRETDITIEEIFQKDDLDLAVLSSFQWDEDWLVSKLDMRRTKILLIAYAKDDTQVRLLTCPGSDCAVTSGPLPHLYSTAEAWV